MTWSVRRHSKKVSKILGELCLTISQSYMCDKIKNEPCANMTRSKGYFSKNT